MAADKSRAALKAYFETGDKPTEAQFADLIDGMINIQDDGSLVSLGTSGQIPFMNATDNDFIYSANFVWDGNRLNVNDAYDSLYLGYLAGPQIPVASFSNLAMGSYAGYSMIAGATSNVILGSEAGYYLTDGDYNVFIGYSAGAYNVGAGSVSNSVCLGHLAGAYETASNKLFIDTLDRTNEATARTSSLIYGVFDATPANQYLRVNGQFQLIDGITAPGTVAGYAQLYIDAADGDLKVIFGDGTIKTITTDT